MRSTLITDILKACLRSLVVNGPLITSRRAIATIADTSASLFLSSWIVRSRKQWGTVAKFLVQAPLSFTEIAMAEFLEALDRYEAQISRFVFFQSMRLPSDKTVSAHMGTRGAGSPLYARWKSRRTRTSSSVLTAGNSSGGLRFARREGSSNSIVFVASFKTFPLTSNDFHLSDNGEFYRSLCVGTFADANGVELLFIPV